MDKKILLIEDNQEVRENTAEILELAGYSVTSACNGKEGIEMAQKEVPDLIICDIMMPVLDGYGVLHMISKKEDLAHIPFIFLTAKSERSDFRKGMEMGADDYLTKPFDDIELLNAIEQRLKKAELVRKEFSKTLDGLNQFFEDAQGINALMKLSETKDTRDYKKKESIYLEDTYPKGIYFISKGKVKTYRTNADGKELITGLYNEGDFFGYLSLLEEGKHIDSAMTLEDAEICLIPKDDFNTLLYKNSDVSRKFIGLLSNNLREREEQLLKLAYNSVRKRVAEALTSLYNRYKKEDDAKFSMTISREDLANLAGTAQETAIRTLSDFKEEGLIDIKGGTITVLNYDKISKMKN